MDKNDFFTAGKNNIGLAGEIFSVQAEPVSETVENASDLFFWPGIPGTHPAHDPTALFG